MKTALPADADMINAQEPWTQIEGLGSRIVEEAQWGLMVFKVPIPAGTAGVITQLPLPSLAAYLPAGQGAVAGARPDLLFDFEVVDVVVRTETAVASSTVQLKKGATAVSDAIISASLNAITRAGTIDPAQSQFLPLSNPAAYAANPLNLVDAGGATAAKRTVFVYVKRL
jgi:hypothetical protein